MFDELEVKRLAQKYNFKCQIINDKILIKSKLDNWLVEVNVGCPKPYVLRHHSSNSCSCHYHRQRQFYDLPFLFKSIKQHDDYLLYGKHRRLERMKRLFDAIKK